jgi:hypothetical protein
MTDGYLCDRCGEFVEATVPNNHAGAFVVEATTYHVGPCCVDKVEELFSDHKD